MVESSELEYQRFSPLRYTSFSTPFLSSFLETLKPTTLLSSTLPLPFCAPAPFLIQSEEEWMSGGGPSINLLPETTISVGFRVGLVLTVLLVSPSLGCYIICSIEELFVLSIRIRKIPGA